MSEPAARGGTGAPGAGTLHRVRANECVHSIAASHGLAWETVWNHPRNGELRQSRSDPSVLREGDLLFVPERAVREESGATGARHTFRRKGVPVWFRLRLLEEGQARRGLRYVLTVDGRSHDGTTDGDGWVKVRVPPSARQGVLTIFDGPEREVHRVALGRLDPVTEESGAVQRLQNLGLLGDPPGDGAFERALRSFQASRKLPVTGELDAATRDALLDAHGS